MGSERANGELVVRLRTNDYGNLRFKTRKEKHTNVSILSVPGARGRSAARDIEKNARKMKREPVREFRISHGDLVDAFDGPQSLNSPHAIVALGYVTPTPCLKRAFAIHLGEDSILRSR